METKYNRNIKIKLPASVRDIIDTLEMGGYEAYAVGGCVRDSIIGSEPKDWDITTSATPEQVKSMFKRTIDTGIKHGTVTVMIKGTGYEVTTYRIDGEYLDSRHPKEVQFTSNLVEDLKRRDFTINAMAYNDKNGIVDCFGGVNDLNDGIIRCVGDARERFTEDALRMLRAVRFSAVLDFDICNETKEAIADLAHTITKISRERIQAELDKLITSKHPEKVRELFKTKLINWIFYNETENENPNEICTNQERLADVLCNSLRDHYIRWAVFGTYMSVADIYKSLKFDNSTIKICSQMLKFSRMELPADEYGLRKAIVLVGKDIFGQYYLPYRASLKNIEPEKLKAVESTYRLIVERGDCLSISEMKIKGSDLAHMGVEPGKKMGEIINYLFEQVLRNHENNSHDTLIALAKEKV